MHSFIKYFFVVYWQAEHFLLMAWFFGLALCAQIAFWHALLLTLYVSTIFFVALLMHCYLEYTVPPTRFLVQKLQQTEQQQQQSQNAQQLGQKQFDSADAWSVLQKMPNQIVRQYVSSEQQRQLFALLCEQSNADQLSEKFFPSNYSNATIMKSCHAPVTCNATVVDKFQSLAHRFFVDAQNEMVTKSASQFCVEVTVLNKENPLAHTMSPNFTVSGLFLILGRSCQASIGHQVVQLNSGDCFFADKNPLQLKNVRVQNDHCSFVPPFVQLDGLGACDSAKHLDMVTAGHTTFVVNISAS